MTTAQEMVEGRRAETSHPAASNGVPFVVLLGGLAGLSAVVMGMILNFLVIEPGPDFDASVAEISSYINRESRALTVSNWMRYAVFLLFPVFAVGLHRYVRGSDQGPQHDFAMVGVIGVVWICAVGTMANSIEVAAVWQADDLASRPETVMALWSVGNALFVAATLAWGTTVFGFTVAGRLSGVLPLWLTVLGGLAAVLSVVSGTGVISVLDGSWAQFPWYGAVPLFMVWVLAMSAHMIRSADPVRVR